MADEFDARLAKARAWFADGDRVPLEFQGKKRGAFSLNRAFIDPHWSDAQRSRGATSLA